jgi:hypothetical protein
VKDSFTVRDLPPAERPRERLIQLGAEALSAQEILALILGRGVKGESVMVMAQKLLSKFGSLQGIADSSVEELSQINGIGRPNGAVEAASIWAEIEAGPREGKLPIKSPEMGRRPGPEGQAGSIGAVAGTRGTATFKTPTVSIDSLDSASCIRVSFGGHLGQRRLVMLFKSPVGDGAVGRHRVDK